MNTNYAGRKAPEVKILARDDFTILREVGSMWLINYSRNSGV